MNRKHFSTFFKVLVITGLILAGSPVLPHHSFAMYDTAISHSMSGKLTRFIPGANHAQLIFERLDDTGEPVIGEDGKQEIWGVETGPSASIARQGVTVKDFPLGTILRVTLNPLRDGRTFGVQDGPIIKCGMAMPAGGCNSETGQAFMTPGD